MSATRRRFLGRAAAALMAAAALVIAVVPFLPDAWNRPVVERGPAVVLTLIVAAAVLWSAAHSRRGRPSPRPRVALAPAADRAAITAPPGRLELTSGTGAQS